MPVGCLNLNFSFFVCTFRFASKIFNLLSLGERDGCGVSSWVFFYFVILDRERCVGGLGGVPCCGLQISERREGNRIVSCEAGCRA